ncbi:aromatic acid exporter family protein [Camelliibacillus cellulosilyticus]|uniref:Aromatic acid exporter family protein n=1 Tax=Camelliibacillus cellulosilyticus TaxID=2174486 RepID=A0ABV9GLD0_9BACL
MGKLLNWLSKTDVVWKTAIASALAWELAHLAGSRHPYLAPITVILSLQATLHRSVHFTIHRVFGTALGVLIVSFFTGRLHVSFWTITLLIFIGCAIAKLIKLSDAVIHQVALSILLVFTLGQAFPTSYGIDRLRDTIIGALIALIFIMIILPSNPAKKAKASFQFVADELTASFTALAHWVAHGCPIEEGNQIHKGNQHFLEDLHKMSNDLNQALKNLRYNPYGKKDREELETYGREILHLRQGYTHLTGMIRTFMEWARTGTMTAFDQALWSSYLHSLAAHVSDWKQTNDSMQNLPSTANAYQIALPPEIDGMRHMCALYTKALEIIVDFRRPIDPSVTS